MSRKIKFEIKDGWLPQIPCEYRPGFKVGSSACELCKYRDRKNNMLYDGFVYCAFEEIRAQEERKWH